MAIQYDGIEAVLLNGGESRRMGRDKATIPIQGVPMAVRIVSALAKESVSVTALGRPVVGASLIADADPFAGPLIALAGFKPRSDLVFVCSCDLPEFDVCLVGALRTVIEGSEAAIPVIEGRAQPLCALYAAGAWEKIGRVVAEGKRSVMAWLDVLSWVAVSEDELLASGLRPESALGVNSEEELKTRGFRRTEVPGPRAG